MLTASVELNGSLYQGYRHFFIKTIRDAGNERDFSPEREATRGTTVPVFFLD